MVKTFEILIVIAAVAAVLFMVWTALFTEPPGIPFELKTQEELEQEYYDQKVDEFMNDYGCGAGYGDPRCR